MDELRRPQTREFQRTRGKPPDSNYDEFLDEDEILEEEITPDDELLNLFKGKKTPDYKVAWDMYQKGLQFNSQINLDETVQVNENFVIGK